jgi:glucokinase
MDVGARHLTVGLADLTGTLIAKATRPEPIACDPEATLHEGVAMLEGLLAEISRPLGDVLAMGVGLPGPVEHRSGRPRRPPIMPGWDGFDVAGWLARHAGIRALVDNDVNLMAMGEQAAVWPEVQDLVFVKASTGIGAGIVSGGTLQRGGLGAAGDLGHVAVPGSEAVICTCGNRGCLEAVAGVPALLKQLSGRARTGEELANLVRAHDPEATAVVREAGRSVGAVLATVASLLNPSVIVFGGRLTDTGEPFLAGIREVVYRRATPLATERLLIVASELTRFAGVTGATRLALTEALSPASIDRLLESLD